MVRWGTVENLLTLGNFSATRETMRNKFRHTQEGSRVLGAGCWVPSPGITAFGLSAFKLYFGICQCGGIYITFRCLSAPSLVGIINCDPLCGFCRLWFDFSPATLFIYLARVELGSVLKKYRRLLSKHTRKKPSYLYNCINTIIC